MRKKNIRPYMIARQNKSGSSQFLSKTVFGFYFFLGGLFFASGFVYLDSINEQAVKGGEIRLVENDLVELRKENTMLRIRSSELTSLHRIESAQEQLRLVALTDFETIEQTGPFALR